MTGIEVREIIEKHNGERGELISILEDIQSRYSYLPEAALREVAELTGRSLVDIYGIATFYRWFSLKPRGRHLVSCCQGTACHVRGAPKIAEELQHQLSIPPGETTADREFSLEVVNCLGACALGPILVSDGHYFSNVTPNKVQAILARTREGLDKVDIKTDDRIFPVEVSCSRCNHSLMDPNYLVDGVPSIKVTASFGEIHGWLLLSALYGSYNSQSEYEIPPETVVEFFCPYCHAELSGAAQCTECAAPMVPMIVRGGGILQICSRKGCRSHRLDLDGVNL
ncbi:MAG: NAD(P)H-dependent oxidoreductase subunit E [Acidobacteria bacterium]|nr:NAD(P)H-dependent oxidoreductase subunit E [Acidobacteriota bacterium]